MTENSNSKKNMLSLAFVVLSLVLIALSVFFIIKLNSPNGEQVAGVTATFYVSNSGNDSNPGTQSSPFKTFAKGIAALTPGAELRIMAGTYNTTLTVNKSGTADLPIRITANGADKVIIDRQNGSNYGIKVTNTSKYVNISNIEVKNVSGTPCAQFSGQYMEIRNLIIHECTEHGLEVDGSDALVIGNTVYRATTSNSARTASSGWGSGIKLKVGADNVRVENNTSYNNYGEGIAATRVRNAVIKGNRVYDNFTVNIYVDNSINTTISNNFITCTPNSGFERDGKAASAVSIGEEQYDGWGAQLENVTIVNNVMAFCNRAVLYFGSDVNGGLDTALIAHNTMWGSVSTAISFESDTNNRNIQIFNNIIQQPENKVCYLASAGAFTFRNNLWVNGSPPSNCRNAADKTGNPLLAGTPDRVNVNNYKLTTSSPAINSAVKIDSVTTDFANGQRYTSTSPSGDIGAFEFTTTGTVPTPVPPTPTPVPPTPTPVPPTPVPPTPVPPTPVPPTRLPPTPSETVCSANQFLENNRCYPLGCAADYNNDARVDAKDLTVFEQNYKKGKISCTFDITGNDCMLTIADLSQFARVYKTNSCL